MTSLLRLGVACVLLAATASFAQTDPFMRGFDAVPVKPTPTRYSGIALDGARLPPKHSWRAGLVFDLNFGILALKLGNEKLGDLVPFRTDAHLTGAYQLFSRLELAVDLPLTVYQYGNFGLLANQGFPEPGIAAAGLGDLRVMPRVAILTEEEFPVALAAIAEVRLPTGDGRSFLGDAAAVIAPRLAAERAFGPVRVLANLGYRLRPRPAQYLNLYVGQEFVTGAGAIIGLPSVGRFHDLQLIGEMHLSTPTEAPFTFSQADSLKTPWELLVGARAKVSRKWGVELSVGRGLGLQSGYGREAFRTLVGVRYETEPPGTAVRGDRDGDGILDAYDGCPDEPEDHDGFQDEDGCMDRDNDADGIDDGQDSCPMEPGPAELDGCPDRDGDEIPDLVDKCPDQPGPAENEGCPFTEGPNIVVESDRIRLRGDIQFETGEARIQKESLPLLDEVVTVLKNRQKLGPVLIEGHTDNRGARAYNQNLSERRAQAVVDYLVSRGIDRKRLRSKGYGFERPIADNDTPLGRAKNRRTEFRLVQEPAEGAPAPQPSPAPAATPTPSGT